MESNIVGKISKEYDFRSFETSILDWWKNNKIYEKLQARKSEKKFYFLDGPPYVTNPPHIGTAWNKLLKDVLIRYKRMSGFEVKDQPGYDCHGLPIEVKVEEDLKVQSKKEIEERITVEAFIDKCKKYALENVQYQTSIFQDLGIWMDWDNPYLTLENDYIESVWWTIKRAKERGLLEKGLKVVHWCPRCETALAGYEVTDEYRTIKDYSIYVKLPFKKETNSYLLIWTTTPWTLPANTAVMVHPDEYYVSVEVNGEKIVLAEKRLRVLAEKFGFKYLVEKKFKGRLLEGMVYEYPLLKNVPIHKGLKKAHRVVLSRAYVNMDEGTGCVHCAPGHGEEDFEVGMENNLDILSPVDETGKFTVDAGDYSGKFVKEADPDIIRDLERCNLLFQKSIIEHSYPHCWRCKTSLILRSTEQWFIKITSLKKRLLDENQKVNWTPKWAGRKRFKDWLQGARDWVISRQRFWGVPMPIWVCKECGEKNVIGSIVELKKKVSEKLDVDSLDLHRHHIDKLKLTCTCGGFMYRIPDIIDVWMDSGAASWASLGYPKTTWEYEKWWPANAIIEAHDQTRGWFYTQLGAGVLCFNKAPYLAVLMHGHTLSPEGQKMSKSLGNFVSPQDVTSKFGRDSLRLYVLSCTTWEDFKFSWKKVEEVFKNLQIIWNIYSFASIYMNLDNFNPEEHSLQDLKEEMRLEDLWLLSRIENLKRRVVNSMNRMEFHLGIKEIIKFAIEDLSHWYIRVVRRRFWLEKENLDKMAAYTTLYYTLKNCIIIIAPFIPFISEKIYLSMFMKAHLNSPISLHHISWPTVKREWINNALEEEVEIIKMIMAASMGARQSLKLKLRQPVEKLIIFTDDERVKTAINNLKQVTLSLTNTKELEVAGVKEERGLEKIEFSPRYDILGPKFKGMTNSIIKILNNVNPEQIYEQIKKNRFFEVKVGVDTFKITEDMVSFMEVMSEGYGKGVFEGGRVYIQSKLSDDLRREGMVREVIRRIQEMRRQLDLPVDGYISVYIAAIDRKFLVGLEQDLDFIKEEVRATDIEFLSGIKKTSPRDYHIQKWKIEDIQFEIGVFHKKLER